MSSAVWDVEELARKYGIALHYRDARGETVRTDLRVIASLLQRMELLSQENGPLDQGPLPPVLVVHPNHGMVEIEFLNPPDQEQIAWRLNLESEETLDGVAVLRKSFSGGKFTCSLMLPKVAFGYHNLELPEIKASASLIVTPDGCHLPKNLGEAQQAWGISLQLYLLRSERNWGIGDFSDLARLSKLAASKGCDALGLNPLHQMFLDKPEHASPYSPLTRSCLNILYIDVEAIPEFRSSEAAQLVGSAEFKEAVAECRASAQVNYTTVTRLKLDALRLVFNRFRSDDANRTRKEQFAAFEEERGDSLQRSSLFQALRDHFSTNIPLPDSWHYWPQQFQSPTSTEVIQFLQEHQTEIRFFNWLQWVADQQLSTASEAATTAGMKIGLYRDLAVGCDRSGCETWSQPSAFLEATQVGAPPDILNPSGQNWGLPPFNPVALRKQAYKPFIDLVRANMRHAGGLRIDHAMGLQRLYCIPEGSPPSEGAYISYPIDDLIGILALESRRNRCIIVGEDLGTVPAGFREKMAAANILSYRVLFFEQDEEHNFVSSDDYPVLAVAVAGSHDLPTLCSWLGETDIELKQRLGLYPSEDEVALQRKLRGTERTAVLKALHLTHNVSEEEFAIGVHRFLGQTKSILAMVQLDDLLGEQEPVNVPGTSIEHPNWRRKYSLTLDELFENRAVCDLIEVLRIERLPSGGTLGQTA